MNNMYYQKFRSERESPRGSGNGYLIILLRFSDVIYSIADYVED